MDLPVSTHQLHFAQTGLQFLNHSLTNLFARKNNKTLRQTLQHRRYTHLVPQVTELYAAYLSEPLGAFLLYLKKQGDSFYQQFLNPYGDLVYCHFKITERAGERGLYLFVVDDNIQYIGQSTTTFSSRLNNGYGYISPKNCFRDGQATNCRVNALIANTYQTVQLYTSVVQDRLAIDQYERQLIRAYQPDWNIALTS